MGAANDFFGMDFGAGAKPASDQQTKGGEPSFIQNALHFFGIDFSTPQPKPITPANPTPTPQSTPENKFDMVHANLIQAESKGRQFDSSGNLLKSSAGAEGIAQVMPDTQIDPGYGVKPMKDKSKDEFIRFSKDYLKAMLKEFDGDYEKALAAYNAGVGNVKKAIAKAEAKGGEWMNYLPKKNETIPYVRKILGNG